MNCQEITKQITTISQKNAEMIDLMDRGKISDAHRLFLEVKKELSKFNEAFVKPIDEFLALIDTEEKALDFASPMQAFSPGLDWPQFLEEKERLLANYPKVPNQGFIITKKNYKYFLEKFAALSQNWIKESDNNLESKILSIFLSSYQSQRALEMESIDSTNIGNRYQAPKRSWGYHLSGPRISIKQMTGSSFEEMLDGDIEIGQISVKEGEGQDNRSYLGQGLAGGRIRAGEIKGFSEVGYTIHDGTIIIEKMGAGMVGDNARGGTIYVKNFSWDYDDREGYAGFCFGSSGGTFFIENISGDFDYMLGLGARQDATVLIKSDRANIRRHCLKMRPGHKKYEYNLVYYDESKDSFQYVDEDREIAQIPMDAGIMTTIPMTSGIRVLEKSSGTPSKIHFDLMEGGILWMKDADCSDIGKGMKNGFIIIDDSSVSYEEVCQRVSPDRQGGVILYLEKSEETTKGIFGTKKRKKAEFREIR